jgi:hypothetical protein
MRVRLLVTTAVLAVLVAGIVVYVGQFLQHNPPPISAKRNANGSVSLTIQTVASYGHHPFPDWVSYLAKDSDGKWEHTTIWKLPAHTVVHVTILQYDGDSGLRNPFLGQVRGTIGGVAKINGTTIHVLNPNLLAHSWTVPDLNISVPLKGVADNAPNQCAVAPCTLAEAHNTIQFSFKTPGPGNYRWQCFVPCAAGFLYGFGGPMQTIGYMDGMLEVS